MLKIKINDQFVFDVDNIADQLKVNDQIIDADIAVVDSSISHVIYQNKSFNTEIVDFNKADKTCIIKVNGNLYNIKVEDQFDQLLKQLGLDNLTSSKVLEIKAPMPGLVLNVLVSENDEIKKGDNLLILEAMKMENILKSTTDGVIKKIMVTKGDKVEKNQILVLFK